MKNNKNNNHNNNKHHSEILEKMAQRGQVDQKSEASSNKNGSMQKGAAPVQGKQQPQQGKPAQGQQQQKPVQGQQKQGQQQGKVDNFKKNK